MNASALLRLSWAVGAAGLVAAACGDSTPVDPKTAHILTGGVIAKESTGAGSNCSVTTPLSVSFPGGGDGCDPLYPGFNQPNANYNSGEGEITVNGNCCHNGQGNVNATFSPAPSPGGSTECTKLNGSNYNNSTNVQCYKGGPSSPTGTLTLNGVQGAYTVSGSCSCNGISVKFDSIPLNG